MVVSTAADCGPDLVVGFEVGFVTSSGDQARVALADAWGLRFEDAAAVRRFVSYRGQRHLSGRWWSATTGRHVGYESWLERDHVMTLDFDPNVVGISSQPFWLFWPHEKPGRFRSHAPDYFARLADGSAMVMDCRPENRRNKPRDIAAFEATRQACELVGWEYQLVGVCDPVRTRNMRWLAGYRHPRYLITETADRLREVIAAGPLGLMEAAASAGDPIATLPVLYHLLWRHEVSTDLTVPLRARSRIWEGAR
ncbi:TnsA-like heteromeric transposase endonuclease subunit [Nocardia sp. 2YAB30]|uniref:TnsA-like heteromeric transposase endonuclease subunit n=1 Tax=Nocardia sp. 2YAB30 TaxID=3233022 RepID=UPI003F9DF088